MVRALSLLALAVFSATAALAEVQGVRSYEPRAYGYFIGDTIERSFEIETATDDTLQMSTLPRPGAVNYWLELRDVDVRTTSRSGASVHSIKLTYQSFYAALDPRKLTIPALAVSVASRSGTERATLPAFTFVTSPIREIFPEKSGETADTFLRPDADPSLVPTRDVRTYVGASGLAMLLALTLLARHLAWWPFHRRPSRPFTRAARDIAYVLRAPASNGAGYLEASLLLHRAFDETAGRRLVASEAPDFLSRHPEHRANDEAVLRFFEASRLAFFGGDSARAQAILSGPDLSALSLRLARAERGAP